MHRSIQVISKVGREKQIVKCLRLQSYRALGTKCFRNNLFKRTSSHNYVERYAAPNWHGGTQYNNFCTGTIPTHYKITLPALSPTMEMGTLVRWTKDEGEQLYEGDLLAEIETDKATMGFETPEEGYLAKIIIPGGSKDVPIGKLLCIIVENKEDVAAFTSYVPTEADNLVIGGTAAEVGADTNAALSSAPVMPTMTSSYPDHVIVNLPALSPTMERGSVNSWEKQEGDTVSEGDLLAEIETDKATVGMESSEDGFLAKILVPTGTKDILLGTSLCIIVPNETDIAAFKDYVASAPAQSAPAASAPATSAPAAAPPAPTPVSAPSPAASQKPGSRIFATPYAKKLASEKGIDLSLLSGTGPDGQIRATDIENFVPAAAAAPAAPAPTPTTAPAGATYMDIPLSNVRKVIAMRLLESKTTIPHYYLTVECQMDSVLRLRKELNTMLEKEKVKLSVNDFVIKAAALACRKVPEANSSWQGDFIRQYNTVDMCVAVATDYGLITPIVPAADKKGLASINNEVQTLATLAREQKLQPHQFQGGTFTISNLGMFGIKSFAAIINPPQACILAVSGTEQRLVPDADAERGYRSTSIMSVTLSCDHRVVDGAVGAQWLKHFRGFLEKPQTMLL